MTLTNGKLVRAFVIRVTKLMFVKFQLRILEYTAFVRPSVRLFSCFVRSKILEHRLTECCEI